MKPKINAWNSAKFCWLNKERKSDSIFSKQRRRSIITFLSKSVVSERIPAFLLFENKIRKNCPNFSQIEEDILAAEKQYSQYALGIANVENTLPEINIENVLYEFVGRPATLTKSDVEERLQAANIPDEMKTPTLDVLFELSFLGLEVEEGEFVFPDTPEESRKKEKLAERFAQMKSKEERYQIHKVFRSFLEIEEDTDRP